MSSSDTSDREYDFALILTGVPELTTDVEDGLFQAGCDDATPASSAVSCPLALLSAAIAAVRLWMSALIMVTRERRALDGRKWGDACMVGWLVMWRW